MSFHFPSDPVFPNCPTLRQPRAKGWATRRWTIMVGFHSLSSSRLVMKNIALFLVLLFSVFS